MILKPVMHSWYQDQRLKQILDKENAVTFPEEDQALDETSLLLTSKMARSIICFYVVTVIPVVTYITVT